MDFAVELVGIDSTPKPTHVGEQLRIRHICWSSYQVSCGYVAISIPVFYYAEAGIACVPKDEIRV
jgi:hypothetical protein